MTTISGFTFVHNAIDGGYPIVEAIRAVQPYVDEVVIIDCASTDNTRLVLDVLRSDLIYHYGYCAADVRILNGEWGNEAGETLRKAHSKYIECRGDIIIHFEADEVYDDDLIRAAAAHARKAKTEDCHFAVYRLQLEQNFQRCRWYPEPVHRVFPRLAGVRKQGHTTDKHDQAVVLPETLGYLWDITNCFRDNWLNRVRQQAELRRSEPQYLMTPLHALHKVELSEAEAQIWLRAGKHWTYKNTPFNIPRVLRPLVGVTKYEPKL